MGGGSNFPNFLHYFGGFLPPGRANVAMGYRRRFEVADSRQVPWLSCRLEEWVRRFGASLPMRMTASWFRSLDLPHTRLWRDSTAPESGLPSDCHPDCTIVLEAVRMRPGEIEPRTRRWKKCVTLLDSKSPIQGPWCRFRREARARERHQHRAGGYSLKALDLDRPIREADIRE